jgi:regulator of sigma E protease
MSIGESIITTIIKILPLLYSIIGLGILIAIHEFGHFTFCKLFNIHTPTFSIGFGPELFRKKIGQTNFRIAAIPLGGYVEISGLAEVGQGEQEHAATTDDTSFKNKYFWQKACVLCGGILFNLLFAYAVFCFLFFKGSDTHKNMITITAIAQNSPAERCGLKPGDTIVSINNITFPCDQEYLFFQGIKTFHQEIRKNPNQKITLTIMRNNKPQVLTAQLDSRQEGDKTIGIIGAFFEAPVPQLSLFKAINAGVTLTNNYICNLIIGIKQLISSRSLNGAMGPVMILSQGASLAKESFFSFFIFLALISISLAIMNLLPIGALDGGQLLFISIESIIRRELPYTFKLVVNLASWVLFIGLAVYLTYHEIGVLFGDKIKILFARLMSIFR